MGDQRNRAQKGDHIFNYVSTMVYGSGGLNGIQVIGLRMQPLP